MELARQIQLRLGLDSPPTTPVGEYLKGERLPQPPALCAMSDALGVSLEWLLRDRGPIDVTPNSDPVILLVGGLVV